ncbi:MAG: hypothetical protein E7552_03165 [Ruminococcaceae bacterium]|nr:hypothetical protein [Oscillospiraceae bacterium]
MTYYITKINGTPHWEDIPAVTLDNILWLPDAGVRMVQQICYDNEALYVHQRAVERDIRAEHRDPQAAVCEDSCMEFFFCPDSTSTRYFNFEWNLNGCLFLGIGEGREDRVRLTMPDGVERFSFRSARTADGWEIFYRIPLAFIRQHFPRCTFAAGAIIRANCYKCGDKTVKPHFLSWNPVTSEQPDFHRSPDFGEMILK